RTRPTRTGSSSSTCRTGGYRRAPDGGSAPGQRIPGASKGEIGGNEAREHPVGCSLGDDRQSVPSRPTFPIPVSESHITPLRAEAVDVYVDVNRHLVHPPHLVEERRRAVVLRIVQVLLVRVVEPAGDRRTGDGGGELGDSGAPHVRP